MAHTPPLDVPRAGGAIMSRHNARVGRIDVHPAIPQIWPGRVHAGGANVVFCDGHVSWYVQRDLVVHDPPTAAEAPTVPMWNSDHRAPGDR